jgi:hypothetical protein
MRTILTLGVLMFVMSFCGLQDRLKGVGGGNTSGPSPSTANTALVEAEKASMTPPQQAIANAATETKWEEQNISWKLPAGWKKIKVVERLFNYGSPDNAFIIASVFEVVDAFPIEASLKSTYDGAVGKVESGEYEKARLLEIDGVRGVEWVETMPAEKDSPRRHQWIAFRKHNGKNQQLNVILSTSGENFDKHRDEFSAVMYSLKIPK